MKTRLFHAWETLRSNYWFVPALMTFLAFCLAFVMIETDQRIEYSALRGTWWIYSGGPEGAREVLSAIAGSMITVAGVAFSITMVALALASQQFGPRLLRNFMRDAGNQIVLGTFIATFLYCLLVMRTIRGLDDNEFVPHVSVSVGVVLALASLGVLIYFIHHVSSSIQADNIVAAVGGELQEAVERLFPEQLGHAPPEPEQDFAQLIPENFERDAAPIAASKSGYLQAVDNEQVLHAARHHELLLRLEQRPGDFVSRGAPLVLAWPASQLTDEAAANLNKAFLMGTQRTLTQDAEFCIRQLVEIALRALSPGINDPFTAMTCIDWLGAAFSDLAGRKMPSRYRFDESDQLRVVADATTFENLLGSAFDPIRRHGASHVMVLHHLLQAMRVIGQNARTDDRRKAIQQQAQIICNAGLENISDENDRTAVQEHFLAVSENLRQIQQQ